MAEQLDGHLDAVRSIVAEKLAIDPARICEDADFAALGADSLLMAEVLIDLEDHFKIAIPESAARSMRTVGDALRYIRSSREIT